MVLLVTAVCCFPDDSIFKDFNGYFLFHLDSFSTIIMLNCLIYLMDGQKKKKTREWMKKGFSLFWSFQGKSHEMPRRKWNSKKIYIFFLE